jgi:DNA-dependent RNA polymerase auxiliary subunit epsilon
MKENKMMYYKYTYKKPGAEYAKAYYVSARSEGNAKQALANELNLPIKAL